MRPSEDAVWLCAPLRSPYLVSTRYSPSLHTCTPKSYTPACLLSESLYSGMPCTALCIPVSLMQTPHILPYTNAINIHSLVYTHTLQLTLLRNQPSDPLSWAAPKVSQHLKASLPSSTGAYAQAWVILTVTPWKALAQTRWWQLLPFQW